MDEDWPGNWEGEDEPRTEKIPGSLSVEELSGAIKNNPDKEVFRQYECGAFLIIGFGALTLLIIPVFLSAAVEGTLAFPLLDTIIVVSLLFIIIWMGVGTCLFREGHMNYIFMDHLGICGKPMYYSQGAIEWEHVMHVEIHQNKYRFLVITTRAKIAKFVFRGNDRALWVSNIFIMGKKITIDILNKYLKGFSKWPSRKKRGYGEGVVIHSNPSLEITDDVYPDGRKPIDEFDDYIGHHATSEIIGSISEEELIVMIREDRSSTRYPDTRSTNFMRMITFMMTFMMVAILILVILTAESVEWNGLLLFTAIVLVPIWCCDLAFTLSRRNKFGIFVNDIGISSRSKYVNTALRWEHVEWMDIWIKDSKLYSIEIVGNRRKLYYKNPKKVERFTLADLQRFLPGYDRWTSYISESWVEGITRYRRNPMG